MNYDILIYMNNKVSNSKKSTHRINLLSTNQNTIFNDCTTNEEIINVIKALHHYVKRNHIFSSEYIEVFSFFLNSWIKEFQQSKYNELKAPIDKYFNWHIDLESLNKKIPCLFNVDYLILNKSHFKSIEVNKENISSINYDKTCILSNLFTIDLSDPIILIDTLFTPQYILVDGNHRFKKALQISQTLPAKIIPFHSIKEEMFVNTFNFKLFKFFNSAQLLGYYSNKLSIEEFKYYAVRLSTPNSIILF